MEMSGGRPTEIRAPVRESPCSSARRERRKRLVITCDMNGASLRWEFLSQNQRSNQLLKMKLRAAEVCRHLVDQRPVGGSLHASGDVAKILLDHTLLALRR